MEDRPVARFLAPVITDYIRKAQDKSIGGEGSHRLLPELEALDREWSQDGRQTRNDHGLKHCLTGVLFTPYEADLNVPEHNESKKSRHGNWEQTSVSRWKDSPDPLPDTDAVMHPDRIDKFETVTPGRGFVRVIVDSVRTMEQYGGVSIEIGEGPEELIRKVKMDCDRQVVLESDGYRSTTWRTLRALQQVHGAEEIWDCTCVTAPSFFRQIGSLDDEVKILGALEAT